ncbi:3-ketodihydrosphingosine reductase TSC10 [Wickerhamiella sorbophila]|uniref:3-ketodihydrosphingosine reductase TSC10 n=1 Tax=Wickerhamiella sorbophila TaxID=45607 RepID=A0A2T0FL06_9ASCO|nr:3-ketodihydrosphingosine reductase TSC10 [Wickerhamiella sorbophila]PRT55652.1 3-ketodihydrosphingosine reductase TSC10 [Wickerhamiella sorbophila]
MLVVISGGSQGLGLSLAKEHVKRGHSIVLVSRTESKLQAAVNDLELVHVSPGHEDQYIKYVSADVSNAKECDQVFGQIGEIPDIVYCCAGASRPGMFIDLSAEDLAQNMQTVYDTALYFSHAALRVMANSPDKLHKRRQLVYCSSTLAVFPFIGYSAYAPGKAAIRALSDIVRQECLAHNIRVSHIVPGTMATEGYTVEEQTKPAITKKIEGPSPPQSPDNCAKYIMKRLDMGDDTVYTDTVTWILGSSMMGTSPRSGWGILQSLVGFFFVIFGRIVAWSIDRDILRDANKQGTEE